MASPKSVKNKSLCVVAIVSETLRIILFPEGNRKNKLFPAPFTFLKLKPYLEQPLLPRA